MGVLETLAVLSTVYGIESANAAKKDARKAAEKQQADAAKALADEKKALEDASAEAEEERRKRIKAAAGSNTITTSPLGLTGTAPTAKKTLLGQ